MAVFETSSSSKELISDVVCSQWIFYQIGEISKEYCLKKEMEKNSTSGNSQS